MLNLEPQELYFLRSAVEASNIKGTDVRFVATVLNKLDEEFKLLVEKDSEGIPQEVLTNPNLKPQPSPIENSNSNMIPSMTPPAGRATPKVPKSSDKKVKKIKELDAITEE
tara:strand:+ start:14775 stop:15107 length:333 start_codon:yes stop_codon:yes gene_type:complete